MRVRNVAIGAVAVIIGVPLLLVVGLRIAFSIANDTNGSIVTSGESREYLLYVPPSYTPDEPAALVVSLHGAAHWPAGQMATSGWNDVADEHGFIVVYPSGTGFPNVWQVAPGAGLTADVQFIADLIDSLLSTYNIDPARVYVNGLSNGGGMTFAVSCSLSDRVAAVGFVAAAYSLPWTWCTESSPMPMIAFHGTDDQIVPFDGGASGDPVSPSQFPSIPAWTANWAGRNQCSPVPVETDVADDVTRVEYVGCANRSAAVLYEIEAGGHTWPGGEPLPEWATGRTTSSIDATRLMWEFFDG